VDAFTGNFDDDLDLDALMSRVRDAALGGGTTATATPPAAAADTPGQDADLIKVIEAQGEWNEQTRKALVDLVQCLQALRDDWADAHQGLRREMARLAARRAGVTPRTNRGRRAAAKGGKRRS
jgi:predicted secreted protein